MLSNLIRPLPLLGTYPYVMEIDEIDPERKDVGGRLGAARETAGFSQQEVARMFDLNKATVSAWEKGRGDPGIYRLRQLAKLYKTSAESLLYGEAPSNEAMQVAAQFDSLTERQRSTFRALWMAYLQESTDDATVETKMPVTKTEKAGR